MAVLKRAYLSLKCHYVRTLILLFIILCISVMEVIGISLHTAVNNAENESLKQIGAKIGLENNTTYIDKLNQEAIASGHVVKQSTGNGLATASTETPIIKLAPISDYMIQKILTIPGVVGENSVSGDYAKPVDFKNVKTYQGIDPSTQKNTQSPNTRIHKDNVIIDGDLQVDLTDGFRKKQSSLIDGSLPSESNRGALIEEKLAQQNNLAVGDSIKVNPIVKLDDNNQVVQLENAIPIEIKIIGIYKTSDEFNVLSQNFWGEDVYAFSPYNRIYTDFETGQEIFKQNDGSITDADIYVNSPSNMDKVAKEIKRLNFDWTKYQLVNLTASENMEISNQLNKVATNASLIIAFSSLAGAIILILIISMWSKNYVYETGLLLTLGEKKRKIILQHLFELLIITLIAFTVSVFLGSYAAHFIGQSINQNSAITSTTGGGTVAPYDLGPNVSNIQIKPQLIVTNLPIYIGIGFIVIFVASIIPGILVFRYKPREILSKSL